jgi:hypothetical protein
MATTARDDAGGSVIGFAIVFVSFIFHGLIPAPTWVWLVVLALGVLLALEDGISGLDVITLGLAGFMIVGSLMSVANTATSDAPDLTLKEPIPAPAGYAHVLDASYKDSARMYRSQPIPVKTTNAAIAYVVDYYIAGLAPEWMVVEQKEELGVRDTLNVHAKFRQGDTSNGIGIQVYANVAPVGRSAPVILIIQALNCGDDVPGLPSGEVCWQGPV